MGGEGSGAHQQDVSTLLLEVAVARRGLSNAEIARRLGWFQPASGRVGRIWTREGCTYATAEKIARACDIDPVEVGL